ncbi:uncharacterized protein [Littorina saxatilis]|uniref:Uncharacterized protein n=1 Tax=Littorina saxatilis TaxID=31220 RepID=A0AAN9FYA9_9CAEN
MRKNGDETEADFCRLLRNWYRADDDGGLDSALRLQWRLSLRTCLLQRYNPHHFPPPAGYVGGIPVVTFESLLTNIERKAQMYCFAEDGSFNARALSTLDAENFFSILGDLTPGGVGLAIRPADIPRALKTACEMTILQADSNKSFFVHTTRAPVYPKLQACPPVDQLPEEREREEVGVSNMSSIQTRNHDFDMPARRQRRGNRKAATVSKPNEPSKGARGVRQHHKCDETKILPHVRLGVIVD